ncbi:insulin-like growth factor-binding protein 7, partial [Sceloporus undulatus]|uniref:insulin-like growth factor-binding protein 7 n=1 Tax=Sceloporus undulatus TaxID=8520 RepID=UPI001C4ADCC4
MLSSSSACLPSGLLLALLLLGSSDGGTPLPPSPAPPALPGCPPCLPSSCPPLPPKGCPLGKARDGCGCCWQCSRGEGEACGFSPAAASSSSSSPGGFGRCGPGLECRRRPKSRGPGVCLCKSRYPVCGTDGITYPSPCQLRAASLSSASAQGSKLQQRNKGPCEQGK